jgi:hypothetical protein
MIPEKRDAGGCLAKREKTNKGKDAGSKFEAGEIKPVS